MLTDRDRIMALKCNLRNFDWGVLQQYRLEKEDATALLKVLDSLDNTKEKEI